MLKQTSEHLFRSEAVILTNGTFLNGLMHVGFSKITGGRSGDQASFGLSEQMMKVGFVVERLKTGTSARIDGRTIDFARMAEQKGDQDLKKFSFMSGVTEIREERSCYITHTNIKGSRGITERTKIQSAFYRKD